MSKAELVQLFEHWASEAREGRVLYAGVAAALTNDQIAVHDGGYRGFETNCLMAVKHLQEQIEGVLAPRRLTDRDFSLDASHVEYPLVSGISWDFLPWLIDAEMRRIREGASAPLKVTFTMPEEIDPRRVEFFNNVCRPLLPLIGAVEVNVPGGRYNPFFTRIGLVAAARGGAAIPRLHASDEAHRTMGAWLHGEKPVVITLREVNYFSNRNSDADAWIKFAGDLERNGQPVVFVRDTAKAAHAVDGFATCPQAAIDVQIRMALYEHALVNFCVGNGPGELLIFSNLPYAYFTNIKPDDTTDLRSWKVDHGLEEYEQWPWSAINQVLFWQSDTYENISAAWERLALEVVNV